MNYENWRILLDFLNGATIDINERGILLNGKESNLKEAQFLIRKAQHEFFEECRINLAKEENSRNVLGTFKDLVFKLDCLQDDFFSISNREGENKIITYMPLNITIAPEGDGITEQIILCIFQTIDRTRNYLLQKIDNFNSSFTQVENHPPKKGAYNSSYQVSGYLLHPNLKIKNYEARNTRLQTAFDELVLSELIEDGTFHEFLQLFNGTCPLKKIIWTGSKEELKYFISQLHLNDIIEDPKRKLFSIAEDSFLYKNGDTITSGTLSARKMLTNTMKVDAIIEILKG